jgi:hypothetical protein
MTCSSRGKPSLYIERLQNRGPDDWAGAGYGNNGGGNHQPADAADYPSTFNN